MNLWKKGVAASLSLLLVFSITPVHAEDFESYDEYDDDEDYDAYEDYDGYGGYEENGDYDDGYIFWRYLAKHASDSYDASQVHPWDDCVQIRGSS